MRAKKLIKNKFFLKKKRMWLRVLWFLIAFDLGVVSVEFHYSNEHCWWST